jgi:hypothetical protein
VVADGRCGTPWCALARNLFRDVSVLPDAELILTKISSVLGCLFSEEEGLACRSAIPHYRNINFNLSFRGYKFAQIEMSKHWKLSKPVKMLTRRP